MSSICAATQQLRELGSQLVNLDLTWGSAGNISMRTGPKQFLVTASGTFLGDLAEDDFVECGLDGMALPGQSAGPSKEAPMHAAIYNEREDIATVIHSHPFYGLLLACSDEEVPQNWFIENMYYQERVCRVGYQHPGSPALAEAVRAQARHANLLILANHGVLAYDTQPKDALLALQSLEIVGRMYATCKAANIPIAALPAEQVREFLQESRYKPRREWPSR